MRRGATVVTLVVGLLALPAPAWAAWTRLVSNHFTFVGDAPERDIRTIAARLEEFRGIVGRILGSEVTNSPVPTVVLVFQNARSFAPFTPVFQGRPVAVAGVFVGMEDVNYIAVNAEQEAEAYGLIFHEYAHFLTGAAVGDTPAWASEGLAEVYQTFETSDGGRSAVIGKPSRQNLQLLQSASSLIPLTELIAIDHDSPLYNEGDRRRLFYAESWALVHYLAFGAPARQGQLKSYLRATADATSPADAFRDAFGADIAALDRELQRYVRAFAFNAMKFQFDERTAANGTSPARAMADADAAGYLGDLMARLNRTDDARTYLKTVVAASPDAARPWAALGLLELRAGNDETALPLLQKAAALAPGEASIQAAYGRALTRRADRGTADDEALYATARTVLARALELEPGNVSTAVTLAEVEMGSGANPSRAVALIERAIKSAPAREEYKLLLAQALAVNGDYQGAARLLTVLTTRASQAQVRQAAAQALTRIADAERAARELLGTAIGDTQSADDPPPARAAEPPQPVPQRETMPQGVFVPTLRTPRAGETRTVGVFSAVECRPGAIVLVIDGTSGPVRLAVKSFDEVEFLTYRQDSPASVACGAQRPAFPALATFRTDAPLAGANTPNRAVAIELLPDGFTVR
ncbi:MAG TPA: tetratricopeptide repeat protein [Vicinamibacterales bacterium]|nr:tetratricopeptide repeat protein [Vicinamibacterales bacterium]